MPITKCDVPATKCDAYVPHCARTPCSLHAVRVTCLARLLSGF